MCLHDFACFCIIFCMILNKRQLGCNRSGLPTVSEHFQQACPAHFEARFCGLSAYLAQARQEAHSAILKRRLLQGHRARTGAVLQLASQSCGGRVRSKRALQHNDLCEFPWRGVSTCGAAGMRRPWRRSDTVRNPCHCAWTASQTPA